MFSVTFVALASNPYVSHTDILAAEESFLDF
jgi:hypothetical protein